MTAVTVRPASTDELVAVMRLLDGALLEVDAETVSERLGTDEVLLAVADAPVGAIVLDGGHVEALAVRPSWRRRGVGTALVEAATATVGRLTAAFDPRVRPFYESLGFDVEPLSTKSEPRLFGVRDESAQGR
ncbi:MAG: GNAT family N-acetyltransferase [Halobacteriota archaeon]